MKKFTTILLLILVIKAFGQNAQFSQYYAASLYLNPAFSGIYNDPALHMNHKRQLQSVDVINELTQVSFIFPVKPNGDFEQSIGGAGIMAFNEKFGFRGVYQKNSAYLNYAHNLKLGLLDSYIISIGAQVGYEIRSLDFSKLAWGSQYNIFYGFDDTLPVPVTEFDEQQQNLVVNAGIMYYYNPERNYLLHNYSAFLGFSATNLNRPNTSFTSDAESIEPMLLKYNGGVEFKFNKLYVTPSLLYLYIRQNQQFNAGLNVAYAPNTDRYRARGTQLLGGVWYRYRDSFIFMGGIKANALTVRVSYDMNSTLFAPEKGVDLAQNSMEISLHYSLGRNLDIKKLSNPLF
ncbi:PorP/SprF family type IX secretion system membrane protein [Ekhidna sp.]|uniref:PorP/SprF family type IX secretion system membrane protein n=1 Tax=Ekhidna sp. TaxID=2608089 RepID=UPI003CCC1A2C